MPTNHSDSPGESSLIQHLIELRSRLLRSIAVVLLVFICLYPFANDMYTLLAQPLLSQLPENATMIATDVTSPFMAPLKLSLLVALLIALPYVFYQVWAFVAPGLYRHERRLIFPLIVSSVVLFYLGLLFAYYLVFPMVLGFFTSIAPEGVSVMTDITSYLDFVLKMFLAFGLVFEVPIVTVVLIYSGLVTVQQLVDKRPYIIVGAFVIGMLLTPPDVFSQTMLAVPMWLLFELGLLVARLIPARTKPEAETVKEDSR
ncbi:MAG: twin arginine-targeting protein translocase TatC [Gammaproteobacteria bacterium RBG_16_57_12]|nr:MAG: twin arginine-targeting protein translocase TatC [Gammaproteobacteria bacterium RBG_16_57_12]